MWEKWWTEFQGFMEISRLTLDLTMMYVTLSFFRWALGLKSAQLAKKRVGGRGVGIHSFNILPSRDIICDTQTAVKKRFQPPHPTNRQYLCSNRGELSGIGFVCGLWWLGLLVEDNLGIAYGILTWQNVKRVNPNPSSRHSFFRQLSRVGSPKERQCYIYKK